MSRYTLLLVIVAITTTACLARHTDVNDGDSANTGSDVGSEHTSDAYDATMVHPDDHQPADLGTDIAVEHPADAYDAPSVIDIDSSHPDVDIDACHPRTCGSIHAACGVIFDGCGGSTTCGPPCSVTPISIDVRHAIYESSVDVLYAGIGPLDAIHPDTFALIDPETGAVHGSFILGGTIGALAKDSYPQPWFGYGNPLRYSWFNRYPEDLFPRGSRTVVPDTRLAALTNTASGLVFAQASPPDGSAGCTIGVYPLPSSTLDACPASFVTEPSGVVYGIAPSPTGSELQIVQASSSGVSATTIPFAVPVAHDTNASIALGRLYTTAGPVYDISNPTSPTLVGSLPIAGGVAVDAIAHVVVVFGNVDMNGANTFVLREYDAGTFEELFSGEVNIPVAADGFVAEMVQTGSNRFAAIGYPNGPSSAASLYVLRVPTGDESAPDGGVDGGIGPDVSDPQTCWSPDAGVFDPNDPTAEAQNRVWYLAHQAVAYYTAMAATGQGSFLSTTWARAPTGGLCFADPPGTWNAPTWTALNFGFAPTEQHRYGYGFEGIGWETTAEFTAQAMGDLDGDGVYSTFEISGGSDGDGGIAVTGLWVNHAWE